MFVNNFGNLSLGLGSLLRLSRVKLCYINIENFKGKYRGRLIYEICCFITFSDINFFFNR